MNLLLFTQADKTAENLIRLSGQRCEHLHKVLRAKVGDSLRIGEVNGLVGTGEILSMEPGAAVLRIELRHAPPPKLPVTLVVALPRPKMLRRILRNSAELGVAQLHLINSYRVEKSYWQTPVLAKDSIRDYLLQGLEQARDTVLPQIHIHARFKPFAEDELPTLSKDRQAFLAHPGDYPPLCGSLTDESVLIIGPEGGFIPYEVEKLEHAGCTPISLGPRILRVENAVTSLLGKFI